MSIFIIAAVSVLTFGACSVRIIDNKEAAGKMVEKTIDVKDFNGLHLSHSANVVYTVSDTFSVRVKASEGDMKNLQFENRDSILHIDYHSSDSDNGRIWNINLRRNNSCTVYISAPYLQHVGISGSADFTCKDTIATKDFEVSIAGSGDVRLKGVKAETVTFKIAGSGDIDASLCDVAYSEFSIAGSGDMDVDFRDCGDASARISGSGDMDFSGTLGTLSQSVAGSGDIKTKKLTLTGKKNQ
ncbi:MAG: DUF2807 domain-containing protein [Prevotella sp.]|nr:DUF2807 domain-containing protein [Prevotella sp.]MDE6151359.1 DUF2807 domain-containing protein [Prevotella sp.]